MQVKVRHARLRSSVFEGSYHDSRALDVKRKEIMAVPLGMNALLLTGKGIAQRLH